MRRVLPVLLGLGAVALGAPPEPGPLLRCAGTTCVASRLPPVLADRDLERYLRSGLTTTLSLSLATRVPAGERRRTSVRIDVRFEPWDESFDVVLVAPPAPPKRERLASSSALVEWWSKLELAFPSHERAAGKAELDLEVIPFSEQEEAETRRWYADALGDDGDRGRPRESMLDALTLTSIKRHGVLKFSWSAQVEPGGPR